MTFEGFKDYAGLLPGVSDSTAQLCYDAAIEHAHGVGIPQALFDADNPKLTLYVYAIAAHWYDKRSFETDGYVQRESSKMRRELMYMTAREGVAGSEEEGGTDG